MDYIIKNKALTVCVSSNGAQMQSIRLNDKDKNKTEYLYQGFPGFWSWQAPVLFPHVGKLKDDYYVYDGNRFDSPQHGFARWQVFETERVSPTKATFSLQANEETRKSFPFDFELKVIYSLIREKIRIEYLVTNTDSQTFSFAIGAHPAFNIPLDDDHSFSDYRISFDKESKVSRLILQDGLVNEALTTETLTEAFDLDRADFENDAIIYELDSPLKIYLADKDKERGVEVETVDFPIVAFWTQTDKQAPFVCIEPWTGVADPLSSDHVWRHKPGMTRLEPGESSSFAYRIRPF